MPAFTTRLIRSLVADSDKPANGRGNVVQLVYARTDPESCEPLVAVCRTEAEARAMQHEVVEAGSRAEIRWETHEVWGEPGDEIYAVMQAPSRSPDPLMELDPVGVKVFAFKDEAELFAARWQQQAGADHFVVWSLRIGWRRSGWPFRTAAAP